MKVWVATTTSEHGIAIQAVCKTEKTALAAIYGYVSRWWEDIEGQYDGRASAPEGTLVPNIPPRDHSEAIGIYFSSHPESESYDVSEMEVVD